MPDKTPTARPAALTPLGDVPWTVRIRPRGGVLDLRLDELWRHRDLIRVFVWRDFVAVYKQSILGPTWYILTPVLTALTYGLIFGRVAAISTDGCPKILFYMSGIVLWNYFATCLSKTSNTFLEHAPIMGKVYFHRLAIPISIVISTFITFAIQFGLILVLMVIYTLCDALFRPTWWILAAPLLSVLMAGFGLGLGVIIASLTTRYRDLMHLVGFATQLLMFMTPVVYPASMVPAKYRWILMANPLAPVVEAFRHGILGTGSASVASLLYSVAAMLLILACGLVLFSKVERDFIDNV